MAKKTNTPHHKAVSELIGRDHERAQIRSCLKARRNVLLEGPVGVGKTHLALAVTAELGTPVFRIDGDNRYSEQKLSGWFDPPTVIKKGYTAEAFFPGPLIEAMKAGGVLFINELNRLPEGVQNVLLPAIDERVIVVPRLGQIRAAEGFLVLATQNPKEFVATSHLSEAILDRFELVVLDYQSEQEETSIVSARLKALVETLAPSMKLLPLASVRLARMTRQHPRIRRGASVRAALSVTEIAAVMIQEGSSFEKAFLAAVLLALPTRIEIERDAESDKSQRQEVESLLKEWTDSVLEELQGGSSKKKTLNQDSSELSEQPAPRVFRSIFTVPQNDRTKQEPPVFFPPEAFGAAMDMAEDEMADDLASASSWDVATRYHEFKNKASMKKIARQLRRLSADAILERAQEVLGSVVRPMEPHLATLRELPGDAEQPDMDLDETLDNSPLQLAGVTQHLAGDYPLSDDDIWMAYSTHRRQPIVLTVDTSLSMTGEKLALTAVALAVVLLEFPEDPIGIVAFENEARVLKRPDEPLSVHQLVERFLDVPAQGYTHLEDGMKAALLVARSASSTGHGRPPSTVLLTDGKYTAGRDPAYLASRFSHLVVLKMGKERASLELCREMAKKEAGRCGKSAIWNHYRL